MKKLSVLRQVEQGNFTNAKKRIFTFFVLFSFSIYFLLKVPKGVHASVFLFIFIERGLHINTSVVKPTPVTTGRITLVLFFFFPRSIKSSACVCVRVLDTRANDVSTHRLRSKFVGTRMTQSGLTREKLLGARVCRPSENSAKAQI